MPIVILGFLKDAPWRLIAIVAGCALLFVAGWIANGWRWEADAAERLAAQAAAAAEASEQARSREQILQAAIMTIDAEHTAERTKADEETAQLRAAVDAGGVRLRVAAICPHPGLPQAAAGPVVDHRIGAELDAAARSDYFALRGGLTRLESKLHACQAALLAVTGPVGP